MTKQDIKLTPKQKHVTLTTPQWELLTFLKKVAGTAWIGAFNKNVVNSLIKKGLAEQTKDYNIRLTEAGKKWENN